MAERRAELTAKPVAEVWVAVVRTVDLGQVVGQQLAERVTEGHPDPAHGLVPLFAPRQQAVMQ